MEIYSKFRQLFQDLPPSAIYLAGYLEAKTELSQEVILKFIRKIYLAYSVPTNMMPSIEKKLFEGRIGEVNELLKEKFSLRGSSPSNLITQLKSCNIYKQKIEKKSSEACFVCGKIKKNDEVFVFTECKHGFHKDCIANQLEYLLTKNVWQLRCFICANPISLNDLVLVLPPLLLETYDRIRARSSYRGQFKAQCTNPSCKEIILVCGEDTICEHCETKIRVD